MVALLAKGLVFAALWPAFEGPDEPFHLSRVLDLAEGRLDRWRGVALREDVDRAIRSVPCGEALQAGFGCPPHEAGGSFGNVFASRVGEAPGAPAVNYESQQPVLGYALAAPFVALWPGATASPFVALFAYRIFSLLAFAAGLAICLRVLPPGRHLDWGLLVLLLPGATEGLVRASNDAVSFLFTALLVAGLQGARGTSLWAAVGVATKLPGLGPALGACAELWSRGLRPRAAATLVAVLAAVGALLATRGLGAATYGRRPILDEGPVGIVVGLAKSGYGVVKTALWLGGWTGFRPGPLSLALMTIGLAIALVVIVPGLERDLRWVGAVVIVAGTLAIAVGNRGVFGVWGGLGGWYVWTWFPWLWRLAADDAGQRVKPWHVAVTAVVVAALNVTWLAPALAVF
ncbi:MAG: DUF2142 domain-containing protein [Acidobacteria bacterium]|nr:DUF2142 domain-containing protein [Acidobacteriota bacterium]